MSKPLRAALLTFAILSGFPPTNAFAGDPVYVIRPPASVGMKSAGILPNDAFEAAPGKGDDAEAPDPGSADAFTWKSNNWDSWLGTLAPWKRSTRVRTVMRFSFPNQSGCQVGGSPGEALFQAQSFGSGIDFIAFEPGRYGLVISCDPTEAPEGHQASMIQMADITVSP